MAGRIYDKNENILARDFLQNQEQNMKDIDIEENKNKDIIRFSIILGRAMVFILVFKLLVNKKK